MVITIPHPERLVEAVRVILHSKSQIVADIPGFVREPRDAATLTREYNFSLESRNADADLTAESAGRLCYLSGHRPNPKTATNQDYLLNICNQRHYSVLGHSFASIYIDGVSRNCTHEIIRHRWFTFSEVSQRYVDASDFEFVEHPGLHGLSHLSGSASERIEVAWHAAQDAYDETVTYLVDGREYPRKKARQAARSILPGGIETKILVSGNLRAWRDFLAQRLSPDADDEIRAVALEVYKIMKAGFPNSFQDFDSQGMITTERLIQRALDRYDKYEQAAVSGQKWIPPRAMYRLAQDVREILDKGLWVLKDDPWEDESCSSAGSTTSSGTTA